MSTSLAHVRPARGVAHLAAACLVVVAAAGCSSGSTSSSPDASPQAASASPAAPTSPPASPAASSATPSAPESSASPATGPDDQVAVALKAIDTAEKEGNGKVFDLEDDTERGQRLWSAKVATSDGRQFDIDVAQDGGKVVRKDEDKTPDDDVDKLRSAKVSLDDAIRTAAGRAEGKGALSSLEIDTAKGSTVVWQIEFGGDDGTTVLVDAASGEVLAAGADVG